MGLHTRVCELLGIERPISGAGAGPIASAELAAAVTNAGGLGMTGAAGDAAELIVGRIRRIRELTRGPTGVNVILQIQPAEVIDAILAEGVEVLATGFGDPAPWVGPAADSGTRVFHRCETADEARDAVAAGVDVVIAQGSDSGGHTGSTPTFSLVPQIVDAAGGQPVLAAGGTRRAAEREPRRRPSDRPVEVIGHRGELEIPRWWVDTPHAGDLGAVDEMALYAGPAAGLVREVLPAAEIVRRIAAGAETELDRLLALRPAGARR